MRALIISTICLGLLVGGWLVFHQYSNQNLHQMIEGCETAVMVSIESEDWQTANEEFGKVYKQWHQYRRKALCFLDTQAINEADISFAKALKYIKAEDVSNGSGEVLGLREQLKSLHLNETVSLDNIL